MTNYVLGFIFAEHLKQVVLIDKNRPSWQRGKLNGVGGKIQDKESPIHAMMRECEEETGLIIPSGEWTLKGKLIINNNDPDYFGDDKEQQVYVFTAKTDVEQAATKTDENVVIVPVDELCVMSNVLLNVQWLVPMCLDETLRLVIAEYDMY